MRSAIALAVPLAIVACTGCVDIIGARVDNRYVEREEKRFTTAGRPDVSLFTFDGSIEVRPWDKSEVEVIVEKRGADKNAIADITVSATQTDNRIDVRVEWPRHKGISFGFSKSARLIVSVPASSDIAAKSGDGSIDIERISGKVELRSGDGSIQARDLAGDVNVQTGDGSITLDGKFSTVRARSGDGSVRIHAAPGTSAGSEWDISTGDGSVTLELPDGFNAELDAHTGDGHVDVQGLTLSNVTGEIRRNTIKGRLGSGGPVVRVRTGDGSIRLRRS
jgi:DUF4097 and DUF4098 domain-containing protein YvlB